MSLGKLVGNLIKKLPSNASKKVKEYFKKNELTVEDNTLKKYFKKSSKELLQLINNGKINNVEFAFLLMQKLNNYLGENKDEILNKNSNLKNGYKTFFTTTPPDTSTEKIYYKKYKSMKKQIKETKNQIEKEKDKNKNQDTKKKWVRAYPNKLIKQSVSLLGKHKLAASAKIKSSTLKEMAEKNKLTVPDFRNILKYKLSKFFGDIAEQIYEKSKYRDMFHDGLKTFYENFDFDKSTRNKQIQDIYNDYLAIKKAINDQKTITLEYEAGGDATSERHKESCTITLKKYSDFKKDLKIQKSNFDSLVNNINNSKEKLNKWYSDLKDQFKNEKDKNSFKEKYDELIAGDILQKCPGAFYKQLSEQWANISKYKNDYKYSFNTFKLLKETKINKDNLPKNPDTFFFLTVLLTLIPQIKNIVDMKKDENIYISIQTKNEIKKLIEKNNTENQTDNLTIKERAASLEAMLKGKSTSNKTIKNESFTIEDDPQNEKYRQEHRKNFQDALDEIKNRKAKLKAEKEKEKEIEEIQEFEELEDNNDLADFEEESSDDITEYENDEMEEPEETEKTKTTKKRGFFGSLKHEVSKVASNAKNNLKSKFKMKKSKK